MIKNQMCVVTDAMSVFARLCLCGSLLVAIPSCAKRPAAPEFYRFDDNLDNATEIKVPAVTEADTGVSFEFDEPDAVPWKVGKNTSICEVRDGCLVFETQAPDSISSPDNLEVDADDMESVLIRIKGVGADAVYLHWRHRGKEYDRANRFKIYLPQQDRWYTYQMRTLNLRLWEGVIDQLQIAAPKGARVEIDFLRIADRRSSFAQSDVGRIQYRLGEAIKTGLYVHCPGQIAYTVRVPKNGYISIGYGVVDGGSPVTFAVLATPANGVAETVYSQQVTENDRWYQATIDMTWYAGKEIEVVFKTECDTVGSIALWSNPILYRARAAGLDGSSGARSRSVQYRDFNVVIYLIDAVRADHLDAYGYDRKTAPTITRLADEGVKFTRCFAQDTWTKSSVSSLFTGTTSWLHGVLEDGDIVPNCFVTLAEILRAHRYATGSVAQNGYPGPITNLARGFSYFERPLYDQETQWFVHTFDLAHEFVQKHKDRPFFLYVHTLEPHAPYEPPEPYAKMFTGPEGKPREIDMYDGDIAWADANLLEFITALKKLDLWDRTLFIVIADHGEGFNEHGMKEHGGTPYNELIHVPLVMRLPGVLPEGKAGDQNVQLIDIAPTILDVLNIPVPGHFEGATLLPLVRGHASDEFAERPVYSRGRWFGGMSLIKGNWKLLCDRSTLALYDIDADFRETNNLANENPSLTNSLLEEAKSYIESQEKLASQLRKEEKEGPVQLDADVLEHLKALGYLK